MSDLLELDKKNREGAKWRGTIDLEEGDETYEITHRMLFDDEIPHVIDIIGEDKFEELFGDADDHADEESREKIQRVQELRAKDEDARTDDEEAELEELLEDEAVAGMSRELFNLMDPDVVEAMQYAAMCGVKADREDGDAVLELTREEQQDRYGDTAKTLDEAMELAESAITHRLVEQGTGLRSLVIGLQVFMASLEEMGN